MRRLLFGVVATALALSAVGGTIAIPEAATPVEKTAARELAEALRRITGVAYDVRPEPAAPDAAYCVGATAAARKLAQAAGWSDFACDEIRRGTVDGRTVLTGDAARGVLYSVDAFLEDVAGVRWWTSGESDYPNRPGWTPGKLEPYRYAPPFRFRETFYRATMTDPDFKVRTKGNTSSYTRYIIPPTEERFIPPEKGGNHKLVFFRGRRSAYHSFFEVLPPHVYAKAHPDWYAEVDGKRIGRGQLCVTNPEMLKEYVKNTLALLRQSPDCDSIQVSQNDDNGGICTCAKCRAAFEAEGAWSGPYLAFANKVAEAIEKEFPHVTVDTFAYQFTRKAPKTARPRHNVVVRLCDIECAFNRPLADPTYAANRAFVRDLRDWSRVAAGNLYIWDYQANFRGYMMPHPNLQVFADNIRLFRDAGAVGLFEQGDAMCVGGDFAALKCYVTAHLMWDPSRDARALADEFLTGYYGAAAAPHLKRALELAEASATRADAPDMSCFHFEPFPWITAEACRACCAEMEAALAADRADGGRHVRRIRLAKLGWDHARIQGWNEWKLKGDRAREIDAWKRALEEFGIDAYRETTTRKTLDDYLDKLTDAGQPKTVTFRPGSTEVVVDRKAPPATRFAAEELTNVLSQAFGEAVPLVSRFTKGRTAIVVGTNAWSRAAGLAPEKLERDGYEIVAADGRVYVAGCDDPKAAVQKNLREGRVLPCERGSYFGAIGFLEDYAGARFYFPGELGTVVPKCGRIEVPEGRRAVVPAYSIRKYSHTADGRWFEGERRDSLLHSGKALNHMRLRMGTFDIPCCHGQNKFKFLERFGRTHPEYFVMMPDGKRLLRPDVQHPGHICLTSGVWDEMYRDARSYLKGEDASVRGIPGRSPGTFAWGKNCIDGKYVDVMCQDGLIRCHCDVCKAAYNEGKDWARELIWTKTAEIANKIAAEGIPGYITQMAYTGYRSIPDVAIPSNVLVMVAERGPWSVNEPERYRRDTDQIRAWAKKLGRKVWIWTYICKWRMMDIRDVPNPSPRACAKYYGDLRDAIFGVYAESECDRFLYHYLDYYVTARVCWDPQTDVEALLREHHRLMFGAAADDMAAVYDIFESKWCREIAGRTNDTMVGPMGDPPDETTLWTKVYSPAVIDDLERRFRTALKKVPEGSLEARRIALVGREFLTPLAKAGRRFIAESDPKAALAEAAEGKYPQLLAESDFSGEVRDGLHFGTYAGAKFAAGWSLDGRCRGCARFDTETFVSAPASLRLDSTNRVSLYQPLIGRRGDLPEFVPGRRYRVSFNVKLENVVPTARGGGVSVYLRDGGDAVFPSDTALAGTCDWKRHVYEVLASRRWKKPKTPSFALRMQNATGTAWFDDVRLELLPEDPEDVSPIKSASAEVKDGYARFAATLDVDFRNIFRGERILPFFVFTDADGKETTLAGTQGPKCEAGVPVSRLPAGDVPYTLELRTRLGSVRGFFDGVLKH